MTITLQVEEVIRQLGLSQEAWTSYTESALEYAGERTVHVGESASE
ncbi:MULTISPECIES: hypothetical protein [Paenibacillus]|nr:hypothetical protein [Paenibacillus caseinilyticus]MCZ8519779.1 hypothetical protein [Paenibacillus caseinilyticus]